MKTRLETTHTVFFYLFIASLGLIYPLNISGMSKALYLFGLLVFGIACFNDWKTWLREHPDERRYLIGIVSFALYGLALILIWKYLVPDDPHGLRKRYRDGENLSLFYFALPLFCSIIGLRLKQKTFERAMIFFSISTVLAGIVVLFAYHDINVLFDTPAEFFKGVFQSRLTGEDSRLSKISWIIVFLKDFSFFPTLGTLVSIPFIIKFSGWRRVLMIVVALCNITLLLFTVNKGTTIGLSLAAGLGIFYSLRNFSWKKTVLWSIGIAIVLCIVILALPESFKKRFVDMVNEIGWFFENGHDHGSTSTRLTIWTTLLSHVDSFWLFGDGPIYATDKLSMYLTDAGHGLYVERGFIYHNAYLYFFHHFGIVGLLFLPFLLLYPLYIMIRRKRWSMVLAGILVLYLFAYIEDRYIQSIILLFFVYFGFFNLDKWININKDKS